ncbi:hypothetical protein [Curtobacterium sp. MCBD17_040]|uniref:hypothetical protein n=1 Tax=Curtobacterium sp. MCBD17_040 TaxID=2175674 RepID=UPI0011B5DF19|nr:hypothetical protein [Curtobacterium sp. MCBD17_040]WIB65633.1 hypothetical protein DEI94_16060 [Curtobacterium sp. MCBD17_040]
MRRGVKRDSGIINVALAYMVLASSVVATMLGWFMLTQTQQFEQRQRQQDDLSIMSTAHVLLYDINTSYNAAWLTAAPAQLAASLPHEVADDPSGTLVQVTSIKKPDAYTLTAVITATSPTDSSISVTKTITYRAAGAFMFQGTITNVNEVWVKRSTDDMLALYYIQNAQQVSH